MISGVVAQLDGDSPARIGIGVIDNVGRHFLRGKLKLINLVFLRGALIVGALEHLANRCAQNTQETVGRRKIKRDHRGLGHSIIPFV